MSDKVDFLEKAQKQGAEARDFPELRDQAEVQGLGLTVVALLDRLRDQERDHKANTAELRRDLEGTEDKYQTTRSRLRRRRVSNALSTFLIVLAVLGVAGAGSWFGVEWTHTTNEMDARKAEQTKADQAQIQVDRAAEAEQVRIDRAALAERASLEEQHQNEQALEKLRLDDQFRERHLPLCTDLHAQTKENYERARLAWETVDSMCPVLGAEPLPEKPERSVENDQPTTE